MAYVSKVPRTKLELLVWAEARKFIFGNSFAQIGLTADQGSAFGVDTDAYRVALDAQEQARLAYRSATEAADAAGSKLLSGSNGCVKSINGFAETSADPAAVYETAKISPRKPGTPRPAPAAPVGVRATLDANGDVAVVWGGPRAQIAFRVQRQLLDAAGQATGWTDLPSDGAARFVDPGVPIGTSQVAYRVKALRGGLASGWSEPGQLRFVGTAASETTLRIAA